METHTSIQLNYVAYLNAVGKIIQYIGPTRTQLPT